MTSPHALLPSPDFSVDPGNYIAGLRPYRSSGYRLEKVTWHQRHVIHNYGHGGAGITMSWGCAEKVLQLALATGLPPKTTPVAVLGAGVMGLTAATRLLEEGFKPTVYARVEALPIASLVAGGQWAPSLVKRHPGNAGLSEFQDILRKAFTAHEKRIGLGFGVVRRDNYTLKTSPSFAEVPEDVVPKPEYLPQLPFEKLNVAGYCYKTLLVEPPILMPRLRADLLGGGVQFVARDFKSTADVSALAERLIINCMGLGSNQVWPDAALEPLKGELAILPPQPNLEYLFSSHGYLFPRADGVVVGGNSTSSSNPVPDPVVCRQLVLAMENTFQGNIVTTASKLPAGYLLDK